MTANRAAQHRARTLSKAEGVKYTEALRRVEQAHRESSGACAACGARTLNGGNNPQPWWCPDGDGVCDSCNKGFVIPARRDYSERLHRLHHRPVCVTCYGPLGGHGFISPADPADRICTGCWRLEWAHVGPQTPGHCFLHGAKIPASETEHVVSRDEQVRAEMESVVVGDRIKFGRSERLWWTVVERDERFVVAIRQVPFAPKGEEQYTVVDLTGWTCTYNGVGPGVVRSSLDTMGGGWDESDRGVPWWTGILDALQSDEFSLSPRRVVPVHRIVVKPH